MIIRTIILAAILLAVDLYIFNGLKHLGRMMHPAWFRYITIAFWSVTTVCFIVLAAGLFVDWHDWPKALRTYGFAFIFVTYFSKLFLVLFLAVDDVFRLFRWVAGLFGRDAVGTGEIPLSRSSGTVSRSDFLVKLGFLIASIPFVALLFGMMRGKYQYQVRRLRLTMDNLPAAFNGFRVVQISDIHTGSFMSGDPLRKAVRMVNGLKPDVIFFTGDLVNDLHREVLPFMDVLSELRARHGVFSILGNHDYGDYYRWTDEGAKRKNLENLISAHKEMGWDLLLDEHRHIERDGERITVIGVQNWSARMNFARYGDLEKALRDIRFSPVNILLSHDPSHWKAEVAGKVPQIDLTLSGHTHGFQFGVDIPGFRWSPVQYVYKEWADLYSENGQHLYVNRGLGFLGYPGRVGIMPEITLFELGNG